VSVASGITAHRGTGMGMICSDCDQDGDIDVFVGNDVSGNFLFLNDGQGQFTEAGLLTGLAYDFAGTAQGTMGVDSGDFNNDGLLDFYVTSYQQDLATLYKNLGKGQFQDITFLSGAGAVRSHLSPGERVSLIWTTTDYATCLWPAAICTTTSSFSTTPPPTTPKTSS